MSPETAPEAHSPVMKLAWTGAIAACITLPTGDTVGVTVKILGEDLTNHTRATGPLGDETDEILADAETMALLHEADEDRAAGHTIRDEDLRPQNG